MFVTRPAMARPRATNQHGVRHWAGRRRLSWIGLVFAIVAGTAGVTAPQIVFAQDEQTFFPGTGAVLQGLDKVTATVTTFTAPVDTMVRFGTLDITVRTCQKTPPTQRPERVAFLEVDETNPNTDADRIYSGWMFASSPALAALEHPVYDVWVIDCMNVAIPESGNSEEN